jgi:hypothetical protein
MDPIEEIVQNINLDELREKTPCYFCVAFGISIDDCLIDPLEMHSGPITPDMKCLHCYDTEEESGRLSLTNREKKSAESIIKQFKHYKQKRLDELYNTSQ